MKIKRLNEKAKVPTRGSANAAGYDLYADLPDKELVIWPHDTVLIDTGWAMRMPNNCFGAIFARSGLATKQGLRPANCVGVIDQDYRGPVKVALHNDSDIHQTIRDGERIAQLVIIPYYEVDFDEVEELDITERNEGGFGSTGTR